MTPDCQHKELQWGSGDYYLVCKDCRASWVMRGDDGDEADAKYMTPGFTRQYDDIMVRKSAAVEAQKEQGREALAPGRDHLTVSGTFQSDKYPWCHAGFVPLKITDPMARELLIDYVNRRGQIDAEFRRDLLDAIWAQDGKG